MITLTESTPAAPVTLPPDPERVDAFAGKLLDTLNGGALSLMISLGHRTGLFDTMASIPPASSHDIARTANLDERYVREWLGAMVTGGIAVHDPETGTYTLPVEHATLLTRDTSAPNLAVFSQWVPLLGQVEEEITTCFREGGGVSYAAYPNFHKVMAEVSSMTVVQALEPFILPLIPGLTERLENGIDVLDVGCGAGQALNQLARLYPNSRFVGYDFSREAADTANTQAADAGLANVTFEVRDVASIDDVERFDLITAFDAIHDQARPDRVLEGIARALKPGGVFLMQDIKAHSHVNGNLEHPIGTFLYTVSCMHCMTVSLSNDGMGLGAVWGQELAETMLADAGFRDVSINELEHDITNYYYVARKG
ncbi:MAG: class I SAM-dependent methyltransferase [Leptospirillia bacterium]